MIIQDHIEYLKSKGINVVVMKCGAAEEIFVEVQHPRLNDLCERNDTINYHVDAVLDEGSKEDVYNYVYLMDYPLTYMTEQ